MAYTIKGLAKANECSTFDAAGLAELWHYWYICNMNDKQSINDFKSLRKADRQSMLSFLRSEPFYSELYNHIINNII